MGGSRQTIQGAGRASEFAVGGMSCACCVGRVERELKAVPGVVAASVNLATERATVHGSADADALLAASVRAGYGGTPIGSAPSAADEEAAARRRDAERAGLRRDLLLATALALPVFL